VTLPGAPETPAQPTAGPATDDPFLGSMVGERYRVLERIGEGGMGAIYRAEHVLMKKVVALKVLHPELGRLEEIARRFEREAQSASRLSHENIVQVTDFGRTPAGALFLVMEFLRGEPLSVTIARSARLPVARAVGITRQVLHALEHAHAQGVVHRDLKPENIMLVLRDTIPPVDFVKILDFGIAKMSEDAPAGSGTPLTQAGVVFGTPDYMSPEQAMGEQADGRADLYACGVILYEMLTGKKPFFAPSRVEIISMHLTRQPPPPRTVAPQAGIPPALERIVLRALEKKRDQRFPSATAFLSALDALGALHGGEARRSGSASPLSVDAVRARLSALRYRLPARTRRLMPALAVILLLGLFALALVFRSPRRGPTSTPPPPKPVAPEIARPIKLAEEALTRGELLKARTILTQELSAHPDSARVRYLLGNVDFLERHPEDGLEAYQEAIKLDSGYRGDAALLRNVRGLLDDRRLAPEALDLLIKGVGKPAAPALAEVASTDKRIELRRAARKACAELGCLNQVDQVSSYLLDLQQDKTCEERRVAVIALHKLGDRRALDPLRKVRRRRGGLFGLFTGANECMKKELDDAIKSLEGE